MHAKKIFKPYRYAVSPLIVGVAIVVVLLSNNSAAQGAAPKDQEAPPAIPSVGKPEYKINKLPNDTFNPSEKISEDFPVPFPVDI